MNAKKYSNRLVNETSPYLQQHAHNPVEWYPWGDEALERARREDKPILISIGYSACHWCHVMEHESFEDEATARVMNELFINIKVDREERPDLDKIYQTAHQLLMQRPGGWPLNMFLTPDDHMPIFGGTYFPREPRYGMPPFADILRRVAEFYRDNRDGLQEQNASLAAAFRRMEQPDASDAGLSPALLAAARDQQLRQYDSVHGGFGRAPKFPHPTSLERCLRFWWRGRTEGNDEARLRRVAEHSLRAMADGGIHDQVGGGFCRYSVDEYWMIPHFEKMLYDNAQLLPLYADAALAFDEERFRDTTLDIGDWVLREMQSPGGGYYSTLDADSEGEEGKFYVYTRDELRTLLDDDEWDVAAPHWGFDRGANFEGHWYPHVFRALDKVAGDLTLDIETAKARLASAREKLFRYREQRVRPGRDEKILTAWNGLMIAGMAHAGRLLGREDFTASAERALDFVRATLFREGRLYATTKDGRVQHPAYLDDHVFLVHGILELLQARWRDGDLAFAQQLIEQVLERFADPGGGFFFTANDHERLVYRPKPGHDDAIPSGNGIAAQVLLRLGHLLGEQRYLDAAEATLKSLAGEMAGFPSACGSLLTALEEYLYPGEILVLRAPASDLPAWMKAGATGYAPDRQIFPVPADAQGLEGLLAQRGMQHGKATAYLCRGTACEAPITDPDALRAALTPG